MTSLVRNHLLYCAVFGQTVELNFSVNRMSILLNGFSNSCAKLCMLFRSGFLSVEMSNFPFKCRYPQMNFHVFMNGFCVGINRMMHPQLLRVSLSLFYYYRVCLFCCFIIVL